MYNQYVQSTDLAGYIATTTGNKYTIMHTH